MSSYKLNYDNSDERLKNLTLMAYIIFLKRQDNQQVSITMKVYEMIFHKGTYESSRFLF